MVGENVPTPRNLKTFSNTDPRSFLYSSSVRTKKFSFGKCANQSSNMGWYKPQRRRAYKDNTTAHFSVKMLFYQYMDLMVISFKQWSFSMSGFKSFVSSCDGLVEFGSIYFLKLVHRYRRYPLHYQPDGPNSTASWRKIWGTLWFRMFWSPVWCVGCWRRRMQAPRHSRPGPRHWRTGILSTVWSGQLKNSPLDILEVLKLWHNDLYSDFIKIYVWCYVSWNSISL